MENKNRIKIKENKLNFPTEIALHSLKHLLLSCPALPIKVLDKVSFRVMEQSAVAKKLKTPTGQQGLGQEDQNKKNNKVIYRLFWKN